MKHLKSNVIFYLIISISIHALLLFLIREKKEYALLPKNQSNVVIIELAALPSTKEAKQRPEDQAITEQANPQENEQDEPIQQKAVALLDRIEPPNAEQPTPAPTSTAAPQPSPTPTPILRQSPKHSSKRHGSDTKPLQEQPSSAIASTREKSSRSERKQDQEQSNNVKQGMTTGQQHSPQTSSTQVGETSKVKPRRVVECLSCPKPRYPKRALRRGIEGEPRVLITINSNGRVQNVQLERSSGNPEIDNAALDAGRRSRFKAIDGGARVPVSYSIVIKGSDKHQKAIEKQEKQRYTLPAQTGAQKQSTTTSAE